ncbi:hypothetical protein, partial [Escherichia coli]|uniref:hypothetical protein n=1 Tax=Escherichia coli TaxID=562 RepID=UPI001BFE76E6
FGSGWENPVCRITLKDFEDLSYHPQMRDNISYPKENYLKIFGIKFEIDWSSKDRTTEWPIVVQKGSAEVHNIFRFYVASW